jgi:translation initiation factor IF-3
VIPGEPKPKELNFHLAISDHDYGVKMRHAEEALLQGLNVRLQLKFRGREMPYQERGMILIHRMNTDVSGVGVADTEPKLLGKSIISALTPLPPTQRTRKFSL